MSPIRINSQLHSRLHARMSVRPDIIATTPTRKTVRVGGISVPDA